MNKERDNTLSDVLRFISEALAEEDIYECARVLYEDIYVDESYRHSYSHIYSTFVEISDESRGDPIAMVVTNLEKILDYARCNLPFCKDEEFLKKLDKLYDHVSLEYQRMSYTDVLASDVQELQKNVAASQEEVEQYNQSVTDLQKALDSSIEDTKKKSKDLQDSFDSTSKKVTDLESNVLSQIIAVLGIFVAIVVACFGTMEILGNVSALLAEHIPLYKVLVAFFVMALAFMDILALLIYFIGRLCGKPISAPCKYGSCDKCERKKGKCNGCGHFIHSQYHLIITNGALVVMIVLTIILLPGMERNIDKKYYTETTVSDTSTEEPESMPAVMTDEPVEEAPDNVTDEVTT